MDRKEFDRKQQKTQSTIRSIYDYGMGILWLGAGLFFLFSKKMGFDLNFDPLLANIFGGACVLYGLFRMYRGYKKRNYYEE
jgi:hypothetical protein